MNARAWTMLVALSILWGGSFFFVSVAVREIPPLTLVTLRVAIAAAALMIALRALPIALSWTAPVLVACAGMGLLNNAIPFALIVWGQQHIASGLASILNAATPFFTVLVAHALTEERATAPRLAGIAIGFAGVTVMLGPDLLGGLGAAGWAALAILGGTLSYAFAGVWGRRFRALGVAPLGAAAGQTAASTLILLPLAIGFEAPWTLPMPSGTAVAATLALALGSTALAYWIYFRILETAGPVNLLLVTLLIPVTAIALGVLVLGEALLPRHVAGLALVATGLLVLDGRVLRPWRGHSRPPALRS
ncbi:MAG TPA: DMT family transporter [Acetobacteraceae bacterium]|nr:DMT family transporter [Acetobacteraceae bacterium]